MKNHDYHNYLRVRKAMALRDKLAEDKLGIYEQMILIFLGSMMGPTSVDKALASLVKAGYITRNELKIGGRDRVRYALVEAVWDAAWTKKEKTGAVDDNRAPLPTSAADQAVLDGLDSKPAQKDSKLPKQKIDKKQVEEIIALLKTHFGEHETFKEKDADSIMANCTRHCIGIAGDNYSCLSVFEWIFQAEHVRATVAKTDFLGGYIKSRFDDWFVEFKECKDKGEDEDNQALSDDIEATDGDEEKPFDEKENEAEEINRIVAEHLKQMDRAVAY